MSQVERVSEDFSARFGFGLVRHVVVELDSGLVRQNQVQVETAEATQRDHDSETNYPAHRDALLIEKIRVSVAPLPRVQRFEEQLPRNHHNNNAAQKQIEEEQTKVSIIPYADTIVDPRAVVVHF